MAGIQTYIVAVRIGLRAVPDSLYAALALVLAIILALQISSRMHDFEAARDGRGLQSEYQQMMQLWRSFEAQGRQLSGNTSVQVRVRGLALRTQKDVKGANVDHNMSVSNPCLATSDLLKRAYLQPVPAPFSVYGQHRFILRSGFRAAPNAFSAVGLQLFAGHPDAIKRKYLKGECYWVGSDNIEIGGRFRSVYPTEHHELMYETVILICHLDRATNKSGGHGVMLIDGVRTQVYEEAKGELDVFGTPKYFFGFCSYPMYRSLDAQALKDWLQFHNHYVGVQYYILNDGGAVNKELYEVARPYMKAGIMEIVDMRGEFKYETKHNVITLNTCLHRMKYKAQWALFLDFDEFLYAVPPQTVHSILGDYPKSPYITFGSLWWDTKMCRNPGAPYLERMVFHWPHFYCIGKHHRYPQSKCITYYGHRKYVVQPRLVDAVQIHRPIDPKEGGIDLDVRIAHFNHFQGLLRADKPHCSDPLEPYDKREWWAEDTMLADIWKGIKYKTKPMLGTNQVKA